MENMRTRSREATERALRKFHQSSGMFIKFNFNSIADRVTAMNYVSSNQWQQKPLVVTHVWRLAPASRLRGVSGNQRNWCHVQLFYFRRQLERCTVSEVREFQAQASSHYDNRNINLCNIPH